MKKTISIICVLSLLIGLFSSIEQSIYADDKSEPKMIETVSDWAKDEVIESYNTIGDKKELNIYQKDFTKFATRLEFSELASLYYEAMLKTTKAELIDIKNMAATPFEDCDNELVALAYNYEIISGVSASKFAPEGALTREQLCTILYRMIKKAGGIVDIDDKKYEFQKTYQDIDKISDWALEATKYMNSCDILKGNGDDLKPKGKVTREQAIALLGRTYTYYKENAEITKPSYGYSENALQYIHEKLKYSVDGDNNPVIYEEFDDYDNDGKTEGILVCLDKTDQVGDNIVYLEFNEDKTAAMIQDLFNISNKGVVSAKIVLLQGDTNKKLCLNTKTGESAEGFILYKIDSGSIKEFLDRSKFDSEVGKNLLMDKDKNDIYEGYTMQKSSYDVFNYPLFLEFQFSDRGVVFYNGQISLPEYPFYAQDVVKQYLYLTYIKQEYLYNMPFNIYYTLNGVGVDFRLKELSQVAFDKKYVYDLEYLKNIQIGIEPKLGFEYKEKNGKVIIKTRFYGDIDKNFWKKYTFELGKVNNRWVIEKITEQVD